MSAQGSHFQTLHAKSQFTFKTKAFDAFSTQNRPAGLDVGASHGGFETAASDINAKFFQVRASKQSQSQLTDLRPVTNHGPSRNYASYHNYIRRVNRLPVKTPMTYQLKAPYSLQRSAKPGTAQTECRPTGMRAVRANRDAVARVSMPETAASKQHVTHIHFDTQPQTTTANRKLLDHGCENGDEYGAIGKPTNIAEYLKERNEAEAVHSHSLVYSDAEQDLAGTEAQNSSREVKFTLDAGTTEADDGRVYPHPMSEQYSAAIAEQLSRKSRPFKNPAPPPAKPEDPDDLRVKLDALLTELKAKETRKQEEEQARQEALLEGNAAEKKLRQTRVREQPPVTKQLFASLDNITQLGIGKKNSSSQLYVDK